ncbi:unnamed protein product [Chrysoparadoxa australica]
MEGAEETLAAGNGQRDEDARSRKRPRSGKFALPTAQESAHLRKTEDLVKTNLLKLEVEELLKEVQVDHDKKSIKVLEEWLFQVKEMLEQLPPATVTEKGLHKAGVRGIELANHVPSKPQSLEFTAPETFDLVGSYLLRTLVKPSLNIDLAVALPSRCFLSKDYLNHRYFDKRALWVGHIALQFTRGKLAHLVSDVRIMSFKGDPRKPCLLLKPKLAHKQKSGGTTLGDSFVVRILPSLEHDAMNATKMHCGRSNVRPTTLRPEGSPQEPTPSYNNAMLEDITMKRHLTALHTWVNDCPALRDAIVLAKVWLGQRGMRTSHDSLDSFGLSMVFLHLVQSRKLTQSADTLHMLQALFKMLASGDLRTKCLTVDTDPDSGSSKPAALDTEAAELFHRSFPAVLVDTWVGINVLARVSEAAAQELEMEASNSLKLLQGCSHNAFSALFMCRATLWRRYDGFVRLPLHQGHQLANGSRGSPSEEEDRALCNRVLWDHVADKSVRILKQALGDRVTLVRPLCGASGQEASHFQGVPGACGGWAVGEAPPHPTTLAIGLLTHPINVLRVVDRGPPADSGAPAKAFREFWGDKSELRRFSDGSIVEALVWKGGRHKVLEEIIKHSLARHDPTRCQHDQVQFHGSELLDLISARPKLPGLSLPQDGNTLTQAAIQSFDRLVQRLKSLQGMPLRVNTVQAVSPMLRYTSVLPPVPHPLAISPEDPEGNVAAFWHQGSKKSGRVTSVLDPVDIILQFEGSGQWPDEIDAIRHTASAFLIRLSQRLWEQHRLRSEITKSWLDVFSDGYCWRLCLNNDWELNALKRNKSAEAAQLELGTVRLPKHHSSVQGFHALNTMYGPAVRIALKWLHCHMLSGHFTQEAVELLVASTFVSPEPFVQPASTLSAFLRFLLLLAEHDWSGAPLLVDLQQEVTPSERLGLQEKFEAERSSAAGSSRPLAMWLVTAEDRSNDWQPSWTSAAQPEAVVLKRAAAVAKASAGIITSWLSQDCQGGGTGQSASAKAKWQDAFALTKAEVAGFNLAARTAAALCRDPATTLHGSEALAHHIKGARALTVKLYKNMLIGLRQQHQHQHDGGSEAVAPALFAGLNPLQELVEGWRHRFGHLAIFFWNELSPTTVAVVWRPKTFLPRAFAPLECSYAQPVDTGEGSHFLVPSVFEVLHDMQVTAGDLISEIRAT